MRMIKVSNPVETSYHESENIKMFLLSISYDNLQVYKYLNNISVTNSVSVSFKTYKNLYLYGRYLSGYNSCNFY